jgi:hypothetical protein
MSDDDEFTRRRGDMELWEGGPVRREERRMEDHIEQRVLPVLYAVAVVFVVLILAALAVLTWKEVF